MKDMKRALRRHHRQRLLARARHSYAATSREEWAEYWVIRNFNNMQWCSCWLCGHRRKWGGPTAQERRMAQVTWEDLE